MTIQDDIPDRVARLEQQMAECYPNAAAARVLATAADRDVGEFRTILKGHTGVLNALRDTQIEHGRGIKRLETKTDALRFDVEFVRAGVDGLNDRFNLLDDKVSRIEAKVVGHDARFDQVDARFEQVDARFEQVDTRFDRLEARMTDGFSTLAVGQAQITALLKIAIDKSDGQQPETN